MKSLSGLLALPLALTIILIACNDEYSSKLEGNKSSGMMLDIKNPMVVSSEIIISNAESKKGDLPVSSTNADAPTIDKENFSGKLISTQGGSVLIDIDISSGDIAGTYLKIVGAKTYFDIPFDTQGRIFEPGRVFQDTGDPVIEIDIPDNLGAGVFCAEVGVYDTQHRMSNTVLTCVEITELGGNNSDFLSVNEWKAVHFKDIDRSGRSIEHDLGELSIDSLSVKMVCNDDNFEEVTVTKSDRTDNLNFTFSENGFVTINMNAFESGLDLSASNCEQQVYIERQSSTQFNGTWHYNSTSKELILVVEVTNSTSTDEIGEIKILEFKTRFNGATNILSLTQDSEDHNGVETIVFAPV